jgi:putative glutamine amidotransferase
MPITIGITNCSKWANYERWITQGNAFGKSGNEEIRVVMLKTGEGESSFVSHCDGIILTGGEDVQPSLYGKPEYAEEYNITDCNPERDKFEYKILKETEERKIPVLGICRGLQIANVFFGGTLVADLPSKGKYSHSAGPEQDAEHGVTLTENSRLHHITGVEKGKINSHHHQSADLPGKGLIVTAVSDDGVTEGMEKAKKHDDEFFILVQWHPERMDVNNPFSGKLRDAFLKACEEYNKFSDLNQSISVTP